MSLPQCPLQRQAFCKEKGGNFLQLTALYLGYLLLPILSEDQRQYKYIEPASPRKQSAHHQWRGQEAYKYARKRDGADRLFLQRMWLYYLQDS